MTKLKTNHQMGRLFRRVLAILLHALLTIYILTWVMHYDITGTWIHLSGFISLLLLLLFFFTIHAIAFFYFLRSRPKQ
ncbi:MAG: hypothetical protein EOO05_08030 [Chitinophagaceae bacterium]|nr:MAG: hypothetical protein EOO05_08030 [Chitinophagaceae bacterium]